MVNVSFIMFSVPTIYMTSKQDRSDRISDQKFSLDDESFGLGFKFKGCIMHRKELVN